jgi:hypothetical protein
MTFPHQQVALRMIPHARTLRKAREQVKSMVTESNRVGGASRLRPLTPPYMRCRIRRFQLNV